MTKYFTYLTTDLVVSSIHTSQALANTHASNNAHLTACGVRASDDSIAPGWFVTNTTTGEVSVTRTISPALRVEERRREIKELLCAQEAEPALANWSVIDSEARAKCTARWILKTAAASSVDANLSDQDKYEWIKAEASIPTRTWYVLMNLAVWGGMNGDSGYMSSSDTNFWSTAAPADPNNDAPNGRLAVVRNSVSVPSDWATFNIAQYLMGV